MSAECAELFRIARILDSSWLGWLTFGFLAGMFTIWLPVYVVYRCMRGATPCFQCNSYECFGEKAQCDRNKQLWHEQLWREMGYPERPPQ